MIYDQAKGLFWEKHSARYYPMNWYNPWDLEVMSPVRREAGEELWLAGRWALSADMPQAFIERLFGK